MGAIPQVNITIPLNDTGYNFRFTEADTSTTLGRFGFQFPFETDELFPNQSLAGAFFPGYNTAGSPMTSTPQNFTLQQHAKTGYAVSGSVPAEVGFAFDGTNFLEIEYDGSTGTISAKLTIWPNAIDYSTSGMVPLNITNPASFGLSFAGISACFFQDGSQGFIIAALCQFTSGGGFYPELLPVTLDLSSATTWVLDDRANAPPFQSTNSFPLAGVNYMADSSEFPTLQIFENVYDISGASMVVTETLTFSGEISTDAQNALLPNFASGFYYTPLGLFGIDWASGNNSGCWYCRYDCTAYGTVTFTMPDASLGPSSDPSVYWVYNFYNNLSPGVAASTQFWFYPNWDIAGTIWWIRAPLQTGGDYGSKPLTGEVYTTLGSAAHGLMLGTHVGFFQAGQIGGGTK